jgi:ribosome maturation factor RimP
MLKKEHILELAHERINELNKNIFVVELSISSSNNIQLEIDSEVGFVTIDDCVRVSRNIEHNLDREEQDFELSVSSAGIDKPLRHWRQYPKNIGRTLKVRTKSGVSIEGELTSVGEKQITLSFEEVLKLEGAKKKEKFQKTVEVSFDQIQEAKIVISFK